MRIVFRKSLISRSQRDRALFIAPIVIALILLATFAQNKAVLASAWRNPMAVLSERSPGNRAAGALYNTKPAQLVAAAERFKPALATTTPQERVLAATRVRPEPFAEALPTDIVPLDLLPAGVPDTAGFAPMETSPPGLGFVPPLQSRLSPPCCINTLTPPPTTTTPPTPSPVPEPTTWAINILGMFMIGWAMRVRNNKRKLRAGSAQPLPA